MILFIHSSVPKWIILCLKFASFCKNLVHPFFTFHWSAFRIFFICCSLYYNHNNYLFLARTNISYNSHQNSMNTESKKLPLIILLQRANSTLWYHLMQAPPVLILCRPYFNKTLSRKWISGLLSLTLASCHQSWRILKPKWGVVDNSFRGLSTVVPPHAFETYESNNNRWIS